MSVSIQSDVSGTSGTVKVNGNTAFTFDNAGVLNATTVQHNGTATERISLGTAVTTTSGTTFDFTGIPSWAKKITILFKDVSTNGTAQVGVQLGTSSGIQSTGYAYSATYSNSAGAAGGAGSANAAAFLTTFAGAGQARTGALLLHLASANTWCASGNLGDYSSGAATVSVAGVVQLGATLDRLRIATANGTDTFDAGSVNILVEG